MTRLLVSARDAAEARVAVDAGADLVDLKEPRRGALGPVDAAVLGEVVAQWAGRVPLSAALGELRDGPAPLAPWASGLSYAKVGLAGCGAGDDWPARWGRLVRQWPTPLAAVAVVYADWQAAEAPPPRDVLHAGTELGCRALLVDTCVKDGRSLLDHWPPADLARFVAEVRAAGMLVVLGGALSPDTIPQVLLLRPDYVAVRGAACAGSRSGAICGRRVRELAALVHAPAANGRGFTTSRPGA